MTTTTQTLDEFLRARLDDDEAAARAASPGGWQYGDVESVAGGMLYDTTRTIATMLYEQPEDHDGSIVRHMLSSEADANGRHIVRHDPARVLADVTAKRLILDLRYSTQLQADRAGSDPTHPFVITFRSQLITYDAVLRTLATAYRDHPDYRDEWKP